MGLATVESQYLEGNNRYTCSDRTIADIDTEVMKLLKECYEEAKRMISENKDVMDVLAAHLLEKETITGKEFMKIFREMKGLPEPEEEKKEEEKVSGENEPEVIGTEEDNNEGESENVLPENDSETKWMPPSPGPDRDKEGVPVGRFSNRPMV